VDDQRAEELRAFARQTQGDDCTTRVAYHMGGRQAEPIDQRAQIVGVLGKASLALPSFTLAVAAAVEGNDLNDSPSNGATGAQLLWSAHEPCTRTIGSPLPVDS
jgi:hypothetical protein